MNAKLNVISGTLAVITKSVNLCIIDSTLTACLTDTVNGTIEVRTGFVVDIVSGTANTCFIVKEGSTADTDNGAGKIANENSYGVVAFVTGTGARAVIEDIVPGKASSNIGSIPCS